MTTATVPDPQAAAAPGPVPARPAGRTYDHAKIEALEGELSKLGVTLPATPDDPAFEHLVAELGATNPDLSRRLSAAVADELSVDARSRFTTMSKRGDRKNRLARNATSAMRTTNHKGRQQINPAVVKGAGVLLVAVFGVWFIFFTGEGEKPAENTATTNASGVTATTPGSATTDPASPGAAAGPPTPATPAGTRTVPAAQPALNPDGTSNSATSPAEAAGGQPAAPVTPVQVNNASPPIPTDVDNGTDVGSAAYPSTPDPVVVPVATTPQPVAVRSAPTPTPQDIETLRALYGDGTSGTPATPRAAPVTPRPGTVPAPTTVTVTPARPASTLQVVSAPAGAQTGAATAATAPAGRTAPPPATLMAVSAPARPVPGPARGGATLATQSAPAAPAPTSAARPGLVTNTAPARAPQPAAPEVTYRAVLVTQTGAAQPAPATTPPVASTNTGMYGSSAQRPATAQASAPATLGGLPGSAPRAPALPYRMGDLVTGQLLTGVAFIQPVGGQASMGSQQAANAQKLTVYVQTEDGNRWKGEARLSGGGRIGITFDRVLIGNTEYPIQAEAVGSDKARLPGLQASVRREAPDAANSILQALAGGVKTFAQQSAQGTTTAMPNGTIVTNNPRPNFWVTLGGAVASAYAPGTPTITQVDLVYLDAAAPLAIAIRGAGTP